MVAAHELLRKQLGIPRINTLIGGSIGGQQALEWAVSKPEIFDNLVLLACNARTSPWMIALNESQRLALEADPTFQQQLPEGGKEGLSAARSIALISYRNHKAYNIKQAETDLQKTDGFKASSYQAYQGEKIVKRFDAYSYYTITKALDTHNIGRHRGSIEKALGRIRAKTLLIGINSDILFPPEEVRSMLEHIPAASYEEFDSIYGHDGFLVENEEISRIINRFFRLTSPVARNSKNKFIVN